MLLLPIGGSKHVIVETETACIEIRKQKNNKRQTKVRRIENRSASWGLPRRDGSARNVLEYFGEKLMRSTNDGRMGLPSQVMYIGFQVAYGVAR